MLLSGAAFSWRVFSSRCRSFCLCNLLGFPIHGFLVAFYVLIRVHPRLETSGNTCHLSNWSLRNEKRAMSGRAQMLHCQPCDVHTYVFSRLNEAESSLHVGRLTFYFCLFAALLGAPFKMPLTMMLILPGRNQAPSPPPGCPIPLVFTPLMHLFYRNSKRSHPLAKWWHLRWEWFAER